MVGCQKKENRDCKGLLCMCAEEGKYIFGHTVPPVHRLLSMSVLTSGSVIPGTASAVPVMCGKVTVESMPKRGVMLYRKAGVDKMRRVRVDN